MRPPVSILLIAHPGHELLLHGWLHEVRPVVVALTDGSGGSGRDRTAFSRAIVEEAGGSCSAVFGNHSDRTCYESILKGDSSIFDTWVQRVVKEIVGHECQTLVCDPLEFYNPMHDLANAMGHAAAHAAEITLRRPVEVLTYPITRPHPGREIVTVALSSRALDRKRAAARSYTPLAAEVDSFEPIFDPARESLVQDETFAWPEVSPEPVAYEVTGRNRMRAGRYPDLITYAGHVAPIARGILGSCGAFDPSP